MEQEKHISYGREENGYIIYECDICGVVCKEHFITGYMDFFETDGILHQGIYCDEKWLSSISEIEDLKKELGISCRTRKT